MPWNSADCSVIVSSACLCLVIAKATLKVVPNEVLKRIPTSCVSENFLTRVLWSSVRDLGGPGYLLPKGSWYAFRRLLAPKVLLRHKGSL